MMSKPAVVWGRWWHPIGSVFMLFRAEMDSLWTKFSYLTTILPQIPVHEKGALTKMTKQLTTFTLRKKRCDFLIPPKMLAHSPSPKPQTAAAAQLQECCQPASQNELECFDALFTRDPVEKNIFGTRCAPTSFRWSYGANIHGLFDGYLG